jgi:hypothetical protein
MKLSELSSVIQAAAARITGTVYLRGTDNDSNKSIDHIDLKGKTVVIFNNLPNVTNTIGRSGYIIESIPVELRVLRLAQVDDTTGEGDAIRDHCYDVASRLFDYISASQSIPDVFDYEVEYLGNYNIYDKVLTGCKLVFDFKASRNTYAC